jgi:hypothetical protein
MDFYCYFFVCLFFFVNSVFENLKRKKRHIFIIALVVDEILGKKTKFIEKLRKKMD